MDICEVLQAAYDFVITGDHVARLALADMMEDAGMTTQAEELRGTYPLPPKDLTYITEDEKNTYLIELYVEKLVETAVNNSRRSKHSTLRYTSYTIKRASKKVNWLQVESMDGKEVEIRTPRRSGN